MPCRWLFALICLMLLSLSFSLPSQADTTTDTENNFRASLLALLAKQPEKHFHFQQEKKLAMLNKPLLTEGDLLLKNASADNTATVIWDIQKPYHIRYELTRNSVKESDAAGTRILTIGTNPLAAALTEAMIGAFSGHWENQDNLASIQPSGNLSGWTLEITPRSADLQKLINRILVSGSQENVQRIEILENNNDSTTIQLSELK